MERERPTERVSTYLRLVPPLTSIGHPYKPPFATWRMTRLIILHLQKRHR
ncbi:hypothetical protein Hdeb2414_s0004g00149571 [Helianthus debilis subsp. tardiflorus]